MNPLLIIISFLIIFLSCNIQEKKEKFISNFDNDTYLIFKNYTDTSSINFISKKNDSIALKFISGINNKKKLPYINDTVILHTYQSWIGNEEDAFCGAGDYQLKRHIKVYIDENKKTHTLDIGILSANIEKSFAKFIHYVDSCLKGTYFKTIESSTPFDVNLNIKLNSCRIGSVLITTEKEVDNNFINELYRIIYTSPKWLLEEVPATPTEKKEGSYNRDKLLNLNITANNSKTEIINYTVDSF